MSSYSDIVDLQRKEDITMTRKINLNQLLASLSKFDNLQYEDLSELISLQHSTYQKFFQSAMVLNEEVTLVFETKQDAINFYMDCHYGKQILRNVGVYYDLYNENQLILRPVLNVIGLIDSRQPGLVEISKHLDINFKLEYNQAFTNNTLSLYIHQGQIVNPECHVYISDTLPYLSLGRLNKIIRNEYDFKRLNTTLHVVESEAIYESNRISH